MRLYIASAMARMDSCSSFGTMPATGVPGTRVWRMEAILEAMPRLG